MRVFRPSFSGLLMTVGVVSLVFVAGCDETGADECENVVCPHGQSCKNGKCYYEPFIQEKQDFGMDMADDLDGGPPLTPDARNDFNDIGTDDNGVDAKTDPDLAWDSTIDSPNPKLDTIPDPDQTVDQTVDQSPDYSVDQTVDQAPDHTIDSYVPLPDTTHDSVPIGPPQNVLVPIDFATLKGKQGDCDDSDPFTLFCQAAASRYCRSEGGIQGGGFGPINDDGQLYIVCLTNGTYTENVPIPSIEPPGCDGTQSGTVFDSCHTEGSNSYCVNNAGVPGIGPFEIQAGLGTVSLTCTPNATPKEITNAQASSYGLGCNNVVGDDGFNYACRNTIHEFCVFKGYVSGFGPVQTDGTKSTVLCLN